MSISGNNYTITSKRFFSANSISPSLLASVTDFAYNMCFGEGHHRSHRTGGQIIRRGGEKFCNTFQGKLAEVSLRKLLISNGLPCGEPDFSIYGEGMWDDCDLMVNGKSLSVKSAAFFSNLLLMEEHDYDENGNYLPNLLSGDTASYDYYILVRIKPDIKALFRKQRLMYSDNIGRNQIDNIINSETWNYDIGGWVDHNEFVYAIRNKFIIPQNSTLNVYTKMDADNFYIQSGDMHSISELYPRLK